MPICRFESYRWSHCKSLIVNDLLQTAAGGEPFCQQHGKGSEFARTLPKLRGDPVSQKFWLDDLPQRCNAVTH